MVSEQGDGGGTGSREPSSGANLEPERAGFTQGQSEECRGRPHRRHFRTGGSGRPEQMGQGVGVVQDRGGRRPPGAVMDPVVQMVSPATQEHSDDSCAHLREQ